MKKKSLNEIRKLPYGIQLHSIWQGIIYRCNHDIDNYGKKGIKVCEDWENDFMAFYKWSIENGYRYEAKPFSSNPNRYRNVYTIDRIDSNGNYEPSNCRWVDMKTQNNNKLKIFRARAKKCTQCPLFQLHFGDVQLSNEEIANTLYGLKIQLCKGEV